MYRDQSFPVATSLFPALVFSATLVFSPLASGAAAVVKIDGSSAVYPITEAVAQEFQRAKLHEVHVNVGVSGTSAGFVKFCRGETDISNASRPILKKEMEECAKAGIRFYEMPLAYDALTVVVNPQNAFVSSMSVAELRKLWEPAAQGRIKTWKDLNPAWPAQQIKLYAPGADSGTFESFTEVVVGTARSSRTDVSTAEDHDVLAQRIAADKDALGYLSLDYYVENQKQLKAVAISDGKEAVLP
ncbi:MAG TPA: PstS family phosphate ABC transporter substrate-binding protein, partial [Accumulibacter sp.]|nr:PstS family phosphate ABC transporter substrate-binding protein [Accumulibacter sp.]